MPFGAVFASLLLGAVGVFLPLSALSADAAPTALARVALGMVCLNTAVGLLRRQAWARWGALAVAVVLLVLNDLLAPPGGAVGKLAILLGAVLAVVLLAFPPTGRIEGGRGPAGNALAYASVAGALALVLALVWGGFATTPQSRATEAPLQIAGLSPRVAWSDFGSGIARASQESKPVFVVFETDWCGYCRKMNQTTFKHPGVIERLNRMVAIRVDAEDTSDVAGYSGRDLASKYSVSGYPSLLLLDSAGRVRSRASGYLDPDDFLDWIESVAGAPVSATNNYQTSP